MIHMFLSEFLACEFRNGRIYGTQSAVFARLISLPIRRRKRPTIRSAERTSLLL